MKYNFFFILMSISTFNFSQEKLDSSKVNYPNNLTKLKDCNENLLFKKDFFENIQNVEKLETTIQNESFHNSLLFISKYTKVSFESILNYARQYPYGIFEKDIKIWLKWYEDNKCENIQFKE